MNWFDVIPHMKHNRKCSVVRLTKNNYLVKKSAVIINLICFLCLLLLLMVFISSQLKCNVADIKVILGMKWRSGQYHHHVNYKLPGPVRALLVEPSHCKAKTENFSNAFTYFVLFTQNSLVFRVNLQFLF